MIEKNYNFSAGYRVQFVLNEGDYARNYRVYDSKNDLKVLKLIDYRKLNSSQIDSESQVNEASILKAINHPNIVTYVNDGTEIIDGVKYFYLVTDFISGTTLDKYVQTSKVNKYEAKDIIANILDAVSVLHTAKVPIIHNELNLSNILYDIGSDIKSAKVIDFGHALYLDQEYSALSIDHSNPFYVAPEMSKNLFSKQSDIFSIGAIYYALLSGDPPWFTSISSYQAGNEDVMNRVNVMRQKSLVKPKNVDDHTFAVINKALSINPVDRFNSCDEFIDALSNPNSEYLNLNVEKTKEAKIQTKSSLIKGNGFDDVAGLEELKQILYEDIIDVLNDPEGAKEYGISLPNGMLLWGPPGCGKTYFAEKLCEEVGYNFVIVKPSDLGSIYVHGGQGKIKELFDSARENAPTIIFFDELDALVPNRTSGLNQSTSGEVNEFLTQMSNCSEDGLFIIGATNRPDMIDSAVKRAGRIDKKFYIPRPDKDVRASLFKMYLEKRPLDVGIDYNRLGELTDFYVASDIALICNEAAKKAKKNKGKITESILTEVINKLPGSVGRDELLSYERLRDKLSNEVDSKDISNTRPNSIGFK